MKNIIGRSLSLFFIILFSGCFSHTLPTVKRLEKGEKVWGLSIGTLFNLQKSEEKFNAIPRYSFSIWYGYGDSDRRDYYISLGSDTGVFFNQKLNQSKDRIATFNYGFKIMPTGIEAASPLIPIPKVGINYGEGIKNNKSVGLLCQGIPPKAILNSLYTNIDTKNGSKIYFGRIGIDIPIIIEDPSDSFSFLEIVGGMGSVGK